MTGRKNRAASVKARLMNVAIKRGEVFNLIVVRYGIERLLFRLSQAIGATFARRQTELMPPFEVFSEAYAHDATRQVQWAAFLRRNGLKGASLQFSEVAAMLKRFIEPVVGGL